MNKRGKRAMSLEMMLALGFLAIIALGALLLCLPLSTEDGHALPVWTALFTSVSATCVTGLTLVDVERTFSLFGEIVIMLLIQVGGLGFMVVATAITVFIRKRITLRGRALLSESMSLPGLSGTVRRTIAFLAIVLAVELAGAALLSVRLIPRWGVGRGVFYSLFHAVSAFCNAGFDLFSSPGSLTPYARDPYMLGAVALLIVAGGLGFAVLAEMVSGKRFAKFSLHTKVVLSTTAMLLIGGTALIALLEWNNPETLGALPLGHRASNAFFQAVTVRTAGFNALSQSGLTDGGKLLSGILMFIGASPVSTGGGVKTSTVFLLLALVLSFAKGQEEVTAFKRRLPLAITRTALCILIIFLSLLLGGILLLLAFDPAIPLVDAGYEVASALGTVGLTSAGTVNFSKPSQAVLMLYMYIGRVGPMTLMLTLTGRMERRGSSIRFPEEQILVG